MKSVTFVIAAITVTTAACEPPTFGRITLIHESGDPKTYPSAQVEVEWVDDGAPGSARIPEGAGDIALPGSFTVEPTTLNDSGCSSVFGVRIIADGVAIACNSRFDAFVCKATGDDATDGLGQLVTVRDDTGDGACATAPFFSTSP